MKIFRSTHERRTYVYIIHIAIRTLYYFYHVAYLMKFDKKYITNDKNMKYIPKKLKLSTKFYFQSSFNM